MKRMCWRLSQSQQTALRQTHGHQEPSLNLRKEWLSRRSLPKTAQRVQMPLVCAWEEQHLLSVLHQHTMSERNFACAKWCRLLTIGTKAYASALELAQDAETFPTKPCDGCVCPTQLTLLSRL